MAQLIFKKRKNKFYIYNKLKKQINIVSQKKFENITLGIVIDTALKIPPNTGVTYRLYYLSKKLIEKGIGVKIFLCNRNFRNDREIENLFQAPKLEFHIVPEKIFYNVRKLNEIIERNSINLLQVEDPVSVLRYEAIAENLNIPICLEMHDVEITLMKYLKYNSEEIEFRKAISYFACALAEKVICMTPLDFSELIYKIGVEMNKLVLIPNGVDLKEFPYYGPKLNRRNIIFIGNMFYWPNQNAVELISKKIYPKIKGIEGIKFILIGMVPSKIKRKFAKNNFIFTGSVTNLNKFLKESTIALCPIIEGSGMKVKLLNYCAAGLPVITTKIGASGYEKIDSLIIENDLNKYPAIIIDLLTHPNKMKFLGMRNRKSIEKYYNLDKIADKTIQTYQEILNNFYYKNREVKKRKILKLPQPLYLKEKRIKKIRNKNYYIIRNGKIVFKKEFSKTT